ncbi:MAG: hypothetical protein LBR25_04620 [Erysipelotrichaceae bacterium]|nr:hypothetical protein [Erysipelotrichaceae bacterium]
MEILLPFAMQCYSMQKLAYINFQKTPDDIYDAFEIQSFDDDANGKGILVIGYRKDFQLDLYAQPSLHLSRSFYDVIEKGIHSFNERKMANTTFTIDAQGLRMNITFKDLNGREIHIEAWENVEKRKPFSLLAPMGFIIDRPENLLLVYLHHYDYVPKKGSVINLSIAGKELPIDPLPVPMDFVANYFARYSNQPNIVGFNPTHKGAIETFTINPGDRSLHERGMRISLVWNGSQEVAVKRIRSLTSLYPVSVDFKPAFPNLLTLPDGSNIKGQFTIKELPQCGVIGGTYTIEKNLGHMHVTMVPDRGWAPRYTKLSVRLLYFLAKLYTRWPADYQWDAYMEQDALGQWLMTSSWKNNYAKSK